MKTTFSAHHNKLFALLLSLLSFVSITEARDCHYLDYPATAPGEDLTGPTHTCTCSESGSWVNCRVKEEEETLATIVEIAVSDPDNFSTLVTAVQTAGLVDALSSAGPFTVFAPTNEAFAALPEGTLASLLDDPEALADILLYHVVPGKVLAQDIPAFLKADSLLEGNSIQLRSSSMDGVTVNDATVTAADITASNGVIHVIDQILIPGQPVSSRGTLVDVAVATDATSERL